MTSSRWDVARARKRREPEATPDHFCHAAGCTVPVAPKMLMCRPHWAMVPAPLQRAVWAAYVPGQEITKRPTLDYLEIAQRAVDAVRDREARQAAKADQGSFF